MHWRHQASLAALVVVAIAAPVAAQSSSPPASASQPADQPAWEVRGAAALYVLPDEMNYVQPTLAADHGGWHFETRFNYEDINAVSGFVGWNLEFGSSVVLAVTPMLGAVVGSTDGIVPAAAADLSWKRLEFYIESEYVIDTDDFDNRFLYHWSEASVWFTEQIRAGVVTQRTRVYDTPRDVQRGLLFGATKGRLEGAVYVFNPFDDDHFVVASIGVTF